MVHRIYHVTMCYQNISSPTKKVMSNRRWLSFAVVATHLRTNIWTVVQISEPSLKSLNRRSHLWSFPNLYGYVSMIHCFLWGVMIAQLNCVYGRTFKAICWGRFAPKRAINWRRLLNWPLPQPLVELARLSRRDSNPSISSPSNSNPSGYYWLHLFKWPLPSSL